jgi:hypothetical protein
MNIGAAFYSFTLVARSLDVFIEKRDEVLVQILVLRLELLFSVYRYVHDACYWSCIVIRQLRALAFYSYYDSLAPTRVQRVFACS